MFEKGEFVIYETAGVCQVMDVTTIKMDGAQKDRLYYILRPVKESGSSIYCPVDNTKVHIRRIMNRQEAEDLLNEIPDAEELWIPNEKMREDKYREAIRSCDAHRYVQIIKTLYLRRIERMAEKKKITSTDEKYLRVAEDALYAELSIPLQIPKERMSDYIADRLEKAKQEL